MSAVCAAQQRCPAVRAIVCFDTACYAPLHEFDPTGTHQHAFNIHSLDLQVPRHRAYPVPRAAAGRSASPACAEPFPRPCRQLAPPRGPPRPLFALGALCSPPAPACIPRPPPAPPLPGPAPPLPRSTPHPGLAPSNPPAFPRSAANFSRSLAISSDSAAEICTGYGFAACTNAGTSGASASPLRNSRSKPPSPSPSSLSCIAVHSGGWIDVSAGLSTACSRLADLKALRHRKQAHSGGKYLVRAVVDQQGVPRREAPLQHRRVPDRTKILEHDLSRAPVSLGPQSASMRRACAGVWARWVYRLMNFLPVEKPRGSAVRLIHDKRQTLFVVRSEDVLGHCANVVIHRGRPYADAEAF
jgi:hypothetical protein